MFMCDVQYVLVRSMILTCSAKNTLRAGAARGLHAGCKKKKKKKRKNARRPSRERVSFPEGSFLSHRVYDCLFVAPELSLTWNFGCHIELIPF